MTTLCNKSVHMALKFIFSLTKRIQEATWKLQDLPTGLQERAKGGGGTLARRQRSGRGLWGLPLTCQTNPSQSSPA